MLFDRFDRGVRYRVFRYRQEVIRKLRKEKGVKLSEILNNHKGSNDFHPDLRDFQSWVLGQLAGPIFQIPDQLEKTGCSKELIAQHERIAEEYVKRLTQEIFEKYEKVKELDILPSHQAPQEPQTEGGEPSTSEVRDVAQDKSSLS